MSERRRRWLEALAVWAGLLAVAAGRWWPALAGRAAFFAEDIPVLNLPVRAYLGEHLRAGQFVLWTPLLQNGFPLFAESQLGALYPPRWLHALPLPAGQVLAASLLLHLAWAGTGLYGYLRCVGLRPVAALLPAVAWAFSPHLVARHQHTNVLEALAWWPWLLLGLELWLRDGRRRQIVGLGLAGGLLALGGHAQFVLYGWTLATAYALWRLAGRPDRGRALGLLAAGAIAGGLAAAQWLPLLELTRHSLRGDAGWERGGHVFHLAHLPLLVAPDFWGPLFEPAFSHPAQRWEKLPYLGLLPLLLAGVGLRGRRPEVRFWAVVGLLGLVAAAGDRLGVYRLLDLLPGWSAFRAPARLLAWFSLATTVLAGLGLERLLAGEWRWTRGFTGLVAGLVVGAGLAWRVLPPLAERAAPGCQAACQGALALAAGLLAVAVVALALARRSPWLAVAVALLDALLAGRSAAPLWPVEETRPPAPFVADRVAVREPWGPVEEWLRPDTNLLLGVPNLYNMSPLSYRNQAELLAVAAAAGPEVLQRCLAQLGVQWAQLTVPGPLGLLPLWPAPAAWWAEQVVVAPDYALARRVALEQPALRATALLPPGATPGPAGPGPGVHVRYPSPNRQSVVWPGRQTGLLVLNATPYPGRRAWADGRPAAVQPVNLVQTGVAVTDAGMVTVVWDSATVRGGFFLGLLALAGAAAGLTSGRRDDG